MCKSSAIKTQTNGPISCYPYDDGNDFGCSDYGLNYEDIPDYVTTRASPEPSSHSSISSDDCHEKTHYFHYAYSISERSRDPVHNNQDWIDNPLGRATRLTKAIPLPTSYIRRTESELELVKETMISESRDLQMFERLVTGLSHHNSFDPYLQKIAVDKIIKSRSIDISSDEQEEKHTIDNDCSMEYDDDAIFEMDL
mmetsp:Transcript_18551/g.42417  ORF Transcript_18551/g.42417 Transcript_18551/m.42417 type:complete len:197 (-) Transcript_18551:58-648(-)|eukprot:CAMPEP_0113302140 /NCGR_PEP_ID=MMETSP0010_2-20120614/3077_1 /TAXON_ID=216773 ORGANISM="Corethron hystrix, Strain 308" /NCGR_SAMPLE_ID=MMETSP0010_2 /ASSEMBLY_ACC=CAM_ASM_000155 /LENGTH=196 /DNA_ID=CAMNT_0000155881 /DNA_START=118 /DNA_END=708 /DNA_ORIENTATION=+ /assembly_acc=CAM_ASM_000155